MPDGATGAAAAPPRGTPSVAGTGVLQLHRRLTGLRAVALVLMVVALGLSSLVVACGDGGTGQIVTASAELPGGLAVTDAAVGEGDRIAAGYLVMTASGAGDRLVAASSPAATRITLHSTAAGGAMKAVDGLELPAGVPVALVPGGDHLMLEGLSAPLTPGATVTLELTFEAAGQIQLSVPVVALVDVLDVYDRGW